MIDFDLPVSESSRALTFFNESKGNLGMDP